MKNMSREEMEAFAFKHGVTDLRAILKLINQKKKEEQQGNVETVSVVDVVVVDDDVVDDVDVVVVVDDDDVDGVNDDLFDHSFCL